MLPLYMQGQYWQWGCVAASLWKAWSGILNQSPPTLVEASLSENGISGSQVNSAYIIKKNIKIGKSSSPLHKKHLRVQGTFYHPCLV